MQRNQQPIGIFDSGMGGLTVLKALQQQLPNEDFIYLGDTARLPYGTKSAATVTRYAIQAAEMIHQYEIKLLVVACNTAASVALPALRAQFHPIPVVGVVAPGAAACIAATKTQHVGILATESTVEFNAYGTVLAQQAPAVTVHQWPCSFLVPLVEEGWTEGALVHEILAKILGPCRHDIQRYAIDTLLLGCTHFPVLKEAIQQVVGAEIQLVDSAETTARAVTAILQEQALGQPDSHHKGQLQVMATDKLTRFSEVATLFMGEAFKDQVNWVAI